MPPPPNTPEQHNPAEDGIVEGDPGRFLSQLLEARHDAPRSRYRPYRRRYPLHSARNLESSNLESRPGSPPVDLVGDSDSSADESQNSVESMVGGRNERMDVGATASTAEGESDGAEDGAARRRPQLDWTALEYVTPVSENLICPICQYPLVSPILTHCGHGFCGGCFKTMLKTSKLCPIDRKAFPSGPGKTHPGTRIIENLLDEMLVRCPNDACQRVDQRCAIKHHYEEECDHTRVPCVDPECEKTLRRMDQRDVCRHTDEPCPKCRVPVDVLNLERHSRDECESSAVDCEYCHGPVGLRRDLAAHHQLCSEVTRPCRNAKDGCKTVCKRDALPQHEQCCPFGVIALRERQLRDEMASLHLKLNIQAQETANLCRRIEIQDAIIKDLMDVINTDNPPVQSAPATASPLLAATTHDSVDDGDKFMRLLADCDVRHNIMVASFNERMFEMRNTIKILFQAVAAHNQAMARASGNGSGTSAGDSGEESQGPNASAPRISSTRRASVSPPPRL